MRNKNDDPIGIFDSGVGGLSVLRRIRSRLPKEDLIYIADSSHAPYGDKPIDYVRQRSVFLMDILLKQNAKAIVVACNTATVTSIKELRSRCRIPIIGIEPGVKPAVSMTRSGVIGVLATTKTLSSPSFNRLIRRFCGGFQVEVQECPGLVEQVEKMALTGQETHGLLKRYITSLLEKGADTLVLGCTHYPFLIPAIKEISGKNIGIIDTGEAVAKQVERRLKESSLLSFKERGGEFFWTTGSGSVQHTISSLWGRPIRVEQIESRGQEQH